jgi:uncharacterized protein YnzC (UPF0291/DUF896 family)
MALPMMGGADAQVRPEEYFPPAPRGDLGGLGGFAPSTNDALRATFMSMMSSPSNNWLQNMPQIYAGLRDDRRYAEKDQRAQAEQMKGREAIKTALIARGVDPAEADILSANPDAARIRLDQITKDEAEKKRQDYLNQFRDTSSPLGNAPRVDDAGDSWAPHRQEFGWAEPGQGDPDTPVQVANAQVEPYTNPPRDGRQSRLGASQPIANPVQGYEAPVQVAQAGPVTLTDASPISATNLDNLYKMEQRYVDLMAGAPDAEARRVAETYLEHVRKQIARAGGGTDETFFGNPVAIQNPDGSIAYGQMGNRGTFRPIELPEGQTFAPPTRTIDTGTETLLLDQAGNVIARTPKENYQAAYDTSSGSADGKSASETRGEYASISSKMPGLEGVIKRLDDLSEKATYTIGGQVIDWAMRQAGVEPRDAAVARAEYTAILDNQILPLLRDTFGAQFTEAEGERLRSTLGDPDKSPAEKQALLKAFIEQKRRDVEALASRAGRPTSTDTAGDGGWKGHNGVRIRIKPQ